MSAGYRDYGTTLLYGGYATTTTVPRMLGDGLGNLLAKAVTANRSRMGEDTHVWASKLAEQTLIELGDLPESHSRKRVT